MRTRNLSLLTDRCWFLSFPQTLKFISDCSCTHTHPHTRRVFLSGCPLMDDEGWSQGVCWRSGEGIYSNNSKATNDSNEATTGMRSIRMLQTATTAQKDTRDTVRVTLRKTFRTQNKRNKQTCHLMANRKAADSCTNLASQTCRRRCEAETGGWEANAAADEEPTRVAN